MDTIRIIVLFIKIIGLFFIVFVILFLFKYLKQDKQDDEQLSDVNSNISQPKSNQHSLIESSQNLFQKPPIFSESNIVKENKEPSKDKTDLTKENQKRNRKLDIKKKEDNPEIQKHIKNLTTAKNYMFSTTNESLLSKIKSFKNESESDFFHSKLQQIIKDFDDIIKFKDSKPEHRYRYAHLDLFDNSRNIIKILNLLLENYKKVKDAVKKIEERIKGFKDENFNDLRICCLSINTEELDIFQTYIDDYKCRIYFCFNHFRSIHMSIFKISYWFFTEPIYEITQYSNIKYYKKACNGFSEKLEEICFDYKNINEICENYSNYLNSYKIAKSYYEKNRPFSFDKEWNTTKKCKEILKKIEKGLKNMFTDMEYHNNTNLKDKRLQVSEDQFIEPI